MTGSGHPAIGRLLVLAMIATLATFAGCRDAVGRHPGPARAASLTAVLVPRAPAAVAEPVTATTPAPPTDPRGKRAFMDKCASCHNEDGAKPLADGPPLRDRGLELEAIQKTVDSRLSTAPADERLGVARYIASLMAKPPSTPVAAR